MLPVLTIQPCDGGDISQSQRELPDRALSATSSLREVNPLSAAGRPIWELLLFMSVQAMSWVIDNAPNDISSGDYLTMLMIANHVSKNGEAAFPTVVLLAEETRLTKTQVLNCITRLETRGLVGVERGGGGRGRKSRYRLPGFDSFLLKVKGIDHLSNSEKVKPVDHLEQERKVKSVDHSENDNGQISDQEWSNSPSGNGQIFETPPTPPYKAEPLIHEPSIEPSDSGSSIRKSDRGSRIPENFSVSPEMRSWAQKNAPLIDVDAATVEFIDYWVGVPGQRGRKADWLATWRNRMRELQDRAVKFERRNRGNGIHQENHRSGAPSGDGFVFKSKSIIR